MQLGVWNRPPSLHRPRDRPHRQWAQVQDFEAIPSLLPWNKRVLGQANGGTSGS